KACRLVVVAAGAFGSLLLLERSGIGAPEVLRRADVSLLVDLLGVGKSYEDHPFLIVPYIVDSSVETFDGLYREDCEVWKQCGEQWNRDGSGLLGTNGVDGAIKVRPLPNEILSLGAEFR
ncbi:hypothetical protein K438DRAFT_1483647, partial [Mycena galopus ATCC 62051]